MIERLNSTHRAKIPKKVKTKKTAKANRKNKSTLRRRGLLRTGLIKHQTRSKYEKQYGRKTSNTDSKQKTVKKHNSVNKLFSLGWKLQAAETEK